MLTLLVEQGGAVILPKTLAVVYGLTAFFHV
jgi:hypothetical protein